MLYTGHQHNGPAVVRYPRGSGNGTVAEPIMQALEIGKARTIKQGKRIAILNFGILMPFALEAAEALNATLVDMRFVKPIDETMLSELAEQHALFVTIEDGAIMGGAGSAVGEFLQAQQLSTKLLKLGLPDQFIMQGTQEQMYAELGLDCAGILAQIKAFEAQ